MIHKDGSVEIKPWEPQPLPSVMCQQGTAMLGYFLGHSDLFVLDAELRKMNYRIRIERDKPGE